MFASQFLAVSQTVVMNVKGLNLTFVIRQLELKGWEAASFGVDGPNNPYNARKLSRQMALFVFSR